MSTDIAAFPRAATPRRRGEELAFLPAAVEVLDTPASPTARWTAAAICGFVVLAIAWSVFGQVDIISSAPGSVKPFGRSKVVQPLEPGIVTRIAVKDGDHVQAGQVLITLDATVAEAARDRAARDLRQAALDLAGLRALRPDGAAGGQAAFRPPLDAPASEIAVAHEAMQARARTQDEKLASLRQQIAAKLGEEHENTAAIERLAASLPFLQKKRDMFRALIRDGLSGISLWADAEQACSDQERQIAVLRLHGAELADARLGLTRDLGQQRASYAHDIFQDLAAAEQKFADLSAEYAAAAQKAKETVLVAPIAGTVQQLAVHTLGGVVTAAQPLLTVVPDDGPLQIEATVQNQDVGFVRAGQTVEVKVTTFPFTRYGLLRGHVLDVSRDAAAPGKSHDKGDAATQDTAEPQPDGYIAHVALDQPSLMVDGVATRLTPGMAVTAEIRTGRRSVISYLVSPLARRGEEAGRER